MFFLSADPFLSSTDFSLFEAVLYGYGYLCLSGLEEFFILLSSLFPAPRFTEQKL